MLYKKLKTVFILCLATVIASTSSITYAMGEVQSPIVEENNVISEETVLDNVDIVNEDDFFENELAVLELKDIVSQKLYYKGEEVTELDITEGLPSDFEEYYVEIQSNNVPTFYGHLIAIEYDSELNKVYAFAYGESFSINGIRIEVPFVKDGVRHEVSPIVNTGITGVADYNEANTIAYQNVVKLTPWLKSSLVVSKGNNLEGDLATKKIKFVLPYDENGKQVLGLTADTVTSIKSIKVVFEDKSFIKYELEYYRTYDGIIAGYKLVGTDLEYQFNNYIVEIDNDLKEELKGVIGHYNYTTDFEPIAYHNRYTVDRRHYKDVFETEIKVDVDGFVHKLLLSNDTYPMYLDNAYLKEKSADGLRDTIKLITFAYTHLTKNFDVNIGGVNLRDLYFFSGRILSNDFTQSYLVNSVQHSGVNHDTLNHYVFHTNVIQHKTKYELYDFMELLMKIEEVGDGNEWFKDTFKGIVIEKNAVGHEAVDYLTYKVWDMLKKLKGNNAHALLFLTAPEDAQKDIIIMTVPSQILITSVNIYHKENTDENRQKVKATMEGLATNYARYYGTSLGFVENGVANLNKDVNVSYDTILKFENPLYKGKLPSVSEEPYAKWIINCRGDGFTNGNAGAVANGMYISYGYMKMLAGFGLFTHENAHNQDSKFFYNGAGRRHGSGAEHHAEGVLTAPDPIKIANNKNYGNMGFNLAKDYNITDFMVSNIKAERIKTKDKIQDFYADMFDSWYAINAMYANAFLASDPEVKRYSSRSINENGTTTQYAYGYTDWSGNGVNNFTKLYDKKVAIRPIETVNSDYYIEDYWNVNWYDRESTTGITDAGTFKRMGQEMLGLKGYDKGFVEWMSKRHPNDRAAIKAITGFEDMRTYKLHRYDEAFKKLGQIPYFNATQMEEVIKDALVESYNVSNGNSTSLDVKKILYSAIKRITEDFENGNIYTRSTNMYEVSDANQLIELANQCNEKGIYVKLTQDIDFSNVATNGKNYYIDQFIGIIDGGNFKIKGLTKPLFDKMYFSVINNVTLEGNANVLLANTSNYIMVHHMNYDVAKKLVTKKNGIFEERLLNVVTE